MTEPELTLLKTSIDHVVLIETAQRGPHYAQPLFVFDEGETPDVFYLEMEPAPGGGFQKTSDSGFSVLLKDILCVQPAPNFEP